MSFLVDIVIIADIFIVFILLIPLNAKLEKQALATRHEISEYTSVLQKWEMFLKLHLKIST